MDVELTAYLFAVAVGFVSSGLICSLWEMATDEELRLARLLDPHPDFAAPLRALFIVFSAPTTMFRDVFAWTLAQPAIGLALAAVALIWGFLQGVFILTQLFGFS